MHHVPMVTASVTFHIQPLPHGELGAYGHCLSHIPHQPLPHGELGAYGHCLSHIPHPTVTAWGTGCLWSLPQSHSTSNRYRMGNWVPMVTASVTFHIQPLPHGELGAYGHCLSHIPHPTVTAWGTGCLWSLPQSHSTSNRYRMGNWVPLAACCLFGAGAQATPLCLHGCQKLIDSWHQTMIIILGAQDSDLVAWRTEGRVSLSVCFFSGVFWCHVTRQSFQSSARAC